MSGYYSTFVILTFLCIVSSWRVDLQRGLWVKVICGASNNDVHLIRNLAYVYTKAGADCFDLCCNPAVVLAATHGINSAMSSNAISARKRPLTMISINDDYDPHFRKAYFDPKLCPVNCHRPCEKVCPANAIPSEHIGVIEERCYGCGRCVNVCPFDNISEKPTVSDSKVIEYILNQKLADAVEIHTGVSNGDNFRKLWSKLGSTILRKTKVISISTTKTKDEDTNLDIDYQEEVFNVMSSSPDYSEFTGVHIWQTDGKSMSGDLADSSTFDTCQFAADVLDRFSNGLHGINFKDSKHFVQVAGGTNPHTVEVLNDMKVLGKPGFGGYGFGSYARRAINKELSVFEDINPGFHVESDPQVLEKCLKIATDLISCVKYQ